MFFHISSGSAVLFTGFSIDKNARAVAVGFFDWVEQGLMSLFLFEILQIVSFDLFVLLVIYGNSAVLVGLAEQVVLGR